MFSEATITKIRDIKEGTSLLIILSIIFGPYFYGIWLAKGCGYRNTYHA